MDRTDGLIMGTQYYRAPLPACEDWERDVANIKRIGMNTVKLFPQWRWHERVRERFEWDDMDRLFELCAKHDLAVYVNVILDVAPDWLFRDGHGVRVSHKGVVLRPGASGCRYVGGWEPCFDDPAVRTEGERFLKAIVERYRGHESLLVWDVWNEPRSRWGDCACDESCNRYREWLRQKYGTIEALNDFWGKAWTTFDDIEPPQVMSDYAEMYLWRHWAMHSVADRVTWAGRIVRALDHDHDVIAHAGACSVIQDVMGDTCEDWLNARHLDGYGSSLCVSAIPGGEFVQRTMPGLHCDWLRNISDPFWIAEVYPDAAGWRTWVSPDELRLRLWSLVAHGAKRVVLWQYRAERVGNESNGHGLVDLQGRPTDRSNEMAAVLRTIDDHREVFQRSRVLPAQVAIVYDQKSDLISRIENTRGDTYAVAGTCEYHHDYKASLQGSYALFWENGIRVDVLSVHDISRIHAYKVVYLPVPLVVDAATSGELVSFVENGGTLISEASLGLRAENTWLNTVNPPGKLADVFGATEPHRETIDQVHEVTVPSLSVTVPATRLRTRIEHSSSDAYGFWDNGDCAVSVCRHGQGQAILLGFYAGAAYLDTGDDRLIGLVGRLMDASGIQPPVRLVLPESGIQARLLASGDDRLLFLLNYDKGQRQCNAAVEGAYHYTELTGTASIEPTETGLRVVLPPRQVAVIHCRKQ